MTDYRALFDIPASTAYFNAAQSGPLAIRTAEAGHAAFRNKMAPWRHTTNALFFDLPESVRAEAAKVFGAAADDIAIVPAASYGLATAARNIALKEGDEIVILDGQFPSNVYTWRALAKQTGAVIRTVSRAETQTWTDALLNAIGEKTALVACGALHWIDGGRIDLVAVSKAVKAQGAALVLDLTQSLGVMPFDLKAVDPDFVVAGAYKWMLGPYATGYLYVAPRHQQGVPLEENWINRSDAQDFTRLIDYRDTYAPGARRFDMGERANHQLLPAALESLRMLNEIGISEVARLCAATSSAIKTAVKPLGLHADIPDQAPHYLSLSLPEDAPSDLAGLLREQDVHASQRGPRLRISAHIYNTPEDVDRLVSALKAILG
ncbi:aminotransferase class V-fold PLP-dependent enzyme [Oceanicaulis sp. LC35]|uniref:aminotransferase class V-fold PLP-dependent enzyme n=1 Tax=Oceanicaulis sp. LC35 TaxID=3349635 RepID=UPI003F8573E4